MNQEEARSQAERAVVALARVIQDNEFAVVGLNTPIANTAYFLAKRTHAPGLLIYGGSAIDVEPHPFSFYGDEQLGDAQSLGQWSYQFLNSFVRSPGLMGIEAVRPIQIDATGAVNATAVRTPDGLVPLAGFASVPETVALCRRRVCYTPDHSPAVFTSEVDTISTRPSDLESRPLHIGTNLGMFTHHGDGALRAQWLWPGVEISDVAVATAFPVVDARTEDFPVEDYVDKLREIDPLGTIALELLSRAERGAFLLRLLEVSQ